VASRFFVFLAFIVTSATACALPEYLEVLTTRYGSVVNDAGCKNCHTSPPQRNAYGDQVKVALKTAKTKTLTPEILKSIDANDPDGDGITNGDKLRKITPSKQAEGKPLVDIPKHSFHPAVSHFPLALFVVAAAFEFLGRRKSNDAYRTAAGFNLGLGLVGSIVTVATGVIAMLRLGFVFSEGNMFIHLLLASSSIIVALVAFFTRKKTSDTYFVLLVLSALLVMAAGHFGGAMVYGG
jgi:uncharacterized membrane protein